MKYDLYLKVILRHEGGLANDKDDPGRITRYGISIRFLKKENIDVDGDGDVDADDILVMTKEKAGIIYKEYFYNILYNVPDGLLKLHLFDMGVNAGSRIAIKILQRALGLKDDGVIGPITLTAINTVPKIVDIYIKARKDYYYDCCLRNPKLKKFLKGWYNRVDSTEFI